MPPSQALRISGDKLLPCRSLCMNTLASSGSITSKRLSETPGSTVQFLSPTSSGRYRLGALGGSRDLFVHAKHLFLEAIGDGWPWGRWLQWFQRMTMSEGTGPSNEERHCADADGDHRFSYDEGPQSRQKHEEAAHDEDCRLGREEMFRCWAHCSLQMDATPS